MYKLLLSSGCPAYPYGVQNKTPIPAEDHLAKYISIGALAGMPDLTTHSLFDEVPDLSEEKPAYKSKCKHKGKYLDPRTDFGAKKIFSNDILLKSFFNCLLKGYTTVDEVYATPAEALGETKEDKAVIFDLSFKNGKGERFLLEMQKQRQRWFMDRSQYYTTFAVREQVLKGERKYRLKRIYSIGILNFNLKEEDLCLRKPEDIKKVLHINVCGKITYIYIQLPKFNKKEHELDRGLDKWLYALKNIHRLTERPEILFEEEFKLLFDMMKTANLTPLEMEQYLRSLKGQMDRESQLKYREEKGLKKGIFKVARSLKENGASIDLIMKSTGLTKEQIEKL